MARADGGSGARFGSRALTMERAIAAAIVAVSLGLALLWAVRVPLFQAPDENTHADYAFTLFSARGPLFALRAVPAADVHPLVRYLEDASDFRKIRFNPDGRVAPAYGSALYRQRVDSAAPRVARDFLSHNGNRVPWVARQYAYFYYALAAATIALGSLASGGAAFAEFMAARVLGVVLLAFSLALTYATMRELGVRGLLALGALAAIAWFPLTSWVSASIQPDNLAFTAVALVFYLSVRLRRERSPLRAASLLGLGLGLLALTKPQYFIAAGLPALADRLVRSARSRPSAGAWVALIAASIVPSLVCAASVFALSAGVGPQVGAVVAANGDPLAIARSHGIGSLLLYLGSQLGAAWRAVFYDGLSFVSYWGAISWTVFRIEFVNVALTNFIFLVLAGFTQVVAALMLLRMLRVWTRLARVAKLRSLKSALELLLSDVPLNAYLLFALEIFALLAATGGALGTQGRYWLPFILPAVLCATRYAPQVLPRGRRAAALAMTAALALYSVVAAPAALGALQARFYSPAMAPLGDEPLTRFTQLGPFAVARQSGPLAACLARGTARFDGWAVDSRSGTPAARVVWTLDGKSQGALRLGFERNDVWLRLHDDSLVRTGFSGSLDTRTLAPGPHELGLAIYERNRAAPYPGRAHVEFEPCLGGRAPRGM